MDLLEPWMLHADWREETRPFLGLDFASWPTGLALDPPPPLPLIGIGPADHPLVAQVDLVEDADVPLARALDAIERTPRTAGALIDLLRATQDMPPEKALTAESFAYAMLQGGAEHRAWRAAQTGEAPCPPGTVDLTRDEATLDILLNRPATRNAIDRQMRDDLFDAFSLAAADDSIARVTLRGAGRCFSVGADLAEFGATTDPAEAHAIRARTLPARALLRCADRVDAHVQGGCVGSGLELAAFAGRLTASPDAWFRLPEVSMGILPGAGGCVSIPRRIGRQRAALLMLSGKRINARTALRWGLIDAIMDDPPGDHRQPDMIG